MSHVIVYGGRAMHVPCAFDEAIRRLLAYRAEDAERIKALEARLREEEGNNASTLVKLHIVTRERDAALEKANAVMGAILWWMGMNLTATQQADAERCVAEALK